MKTTRDPWGSVDHHGPRITPQSQQNAALEQPILPCGKPGLDIWPKQVCEPQGSFGPAEEPAPEVGSQDISYTQPLPFCAHSLQLALTGSWDRSITAATAPPSIGAQPKTPRRSNTLQDKWQQTIMDGRVLITASPPMLQFCWLRLRFISRDRYVKRQKQFLLLNGTQSRLCKYCAVLRENSETR